MASVKRSVTLASKFNMPTLAYGTGTAWFKTKDGKTVVDSKAKEEGCADLETCIIAAIEGGISHIDEAEMYETQEFTGKALRKVLRSTPRDDLFITSKIGKGMDRRGPGVAATVKKAAEELGVDYFDLYLIHAPFIQQLEVDADIVDVYHQLESLVDEGLIRSLGVSNFRIEDLEALLPHVRHPVCVNEVECNPQLQQPDLHAYCEARNIVMVSYSPLAGMGELPPKLQAAVDKPAKRLGVQDAQVLLRWNLETGHTVVTTSSKPSRCLELTKVYDLSLLPEEIAEITKVGRTCPEKRIFWRKAMGLDSTGAA